MVGVLGVVAGSLSGTAAEAQTRARCFTEWAICMQDASDLPGFWDRTFAGADCNLTLAGCVARVFA
jgi:hypothetical protein